MAKVKILEEIHPLNIIREVQKWPVLYVKDSPERANLHFKKKIWNEVAKALFTDWDSFSNKEKDEKVVDLTRRWRNLRDTFKRQLVMEKKVRDGDQTARKKTYVYFKHMLYLLPHVDTSQTETSDPILEPKLDEYFNKQQKRKSPKKSKGTLKRSKVFSTPTTSVDLEDIDEDRHFLLSLVPSFKKMTDDEKLTAKLEILKVIKEVRNKSAQESSIPIDSLSYNDEETDIGDIKVEMLQAETNSGQWNDTDSVESD